MEKIALICKTCIRYQSACAKGEFCRILCPYFQKRYGKGIMARQTNANTLVAHADPRSEYIRGAASGSPAATALLATQLADDALAANGKYTSMIYCLLVR